MRDIGHERRAHLVRDLAERLEVDGTRKGRAARDDQLRPMLAREIADLVEVDPLGVLPDPVGHDRVELAREAHRAARGEVPAVGQVRRQHRVAGLEQREVHGHVRLRARVRLDIDVLGAEQLAGARDGELLGPVDDLAAAVVAPARIALGVLVGEHRADRLEHGLGDEVLRRDQLEVARLPLGLRPDDLGDVGIDLVQRFHGPPRITRETLPSVAPRCQDDR